MKQKTTILCTVLLFVGLAISPATGGFEADEAINYNTLGGDDVVTVYFWDCTVKPKEKIVIELSESEWNNLRDELREIRTTSESIEESFDAQFALLKEYDFISYEITYEILEQKAMDAFKNKNPRPAREPLIDNAIFNAMCAINFELDSGSTTYVFGLNTFIELIGFDIISFHSGHSPDGIETKGVLEQSTDPGDYFGSMFGFLGYWGGTRTGIGKYKDLVIAGFTVFTAWLPSP